MKNKYIQYEDALKRESSINQMKLNGFKFIPKRNKIKIGLGITCLTIAIIPNGFGFIFYPLGFILLGIKKEFLISKYEDLKFKMRGF